MHRASLLEAGEGRTAFRTPHFSGSYHLCVLKSLLESEQVGWGVYPDRYFYFMRCHFCLDLSDPLILRGTLFPCDVKTPELEILFLVSFQKLKTLFQG